MVRDSLFYYSLWAIKFISFTAHEMRCIWCERKLIFHRTMWSLCWHQRSRWWKLSERTAREGNDFEFIKGVSWIEWNISLYASMIIIWIWLDFLREEATAVEAAADCRLLNWGTKRAKGITKRTLREYKRFEFSRHKSQRKLCVGIWEAKFILNLCLSSFYLRPSSEKRRALSTNNCFFFVANRHA